MAALQAGGLHVPCISSVGFPQKSKQEKLACSCYSDHIAFNSLKSWRVVLRPHRNARLLFCSRTHNRTRSFQSISYQDIAENDSEGTEPSASSSTPTLDRRGERVWQQLQGNLQVWGKNFTDRGTMQVARQFLAIRKRSPAEAKPDLARDVARVKFATLWSRVDPSIKWPVAIFLPLYLVVTAAFGSAVSKELWPLWTIWPLATSFYIHAGAQATRKIQQLLLVLLQRSREVAAAVQSGEIQRKLSSRVEFVKSRPGAAQLYLKKNAASDLKKALVVVATWLVERYEDLIDLLWPSWRVLWRKLVNLF